MSRRRVLPALTASLAIAALAGRFAIFLAEASRAGIGPFRAVILFFGYYTVLTNLAIATTAGLPVVLPGARAARWLSSPGVRASVAVYAALLVVAYNVLLGHRIPGGSAELVLDVLLHDVVPGLFLAEWLLRERGVPVPWRSLAVWTIFPLAWLAYTLLRGLSGAEIGYPFLDIPRAGAAAVGRSVAMLFAGFAAASALAIAWTRRRPRRRETLVV